MALPARLSPDVKKPKPRLRSSAPESKVCLRCGETFFRDRSKYSHQQWEDKRFCSQRCGSTVPMAERLSWASVANVDTGCRVWLGTITRRGYGRIVVRDGGRRVQLGAHRAAYEEWVGPIPDGMMVLHSCDNPACINPEHLRIGTHAENMADRSERKRCRNQFGRPKSYASS